MVHFGTRSRAFAGQRIPLSHPLAIFAVLLLVGILFGVIAVAAWQVQSAYATNGIATQAVIVDKQITSRMTNRGIRYDHNVAYEFSVDGQTIRGGSGIDQTLYNALAIGDGLDILYLSNNPTENIPAGNHSLTLPLLLGIPALIINGIALVYAVRALLPWLAGRRAR